MSKLNNIKEVMVALANNKIIITADGERYSLDGEFCIQELVGSA